MEWYTEIKVKKEIVHFLSKLSPFAIRKILTKQELEARHMSKYRDFHPSELPRSSSIFT